MACKSLGVGTYRRRQPVDLRVMGVACGKHYTSANSQMGTMSEMIDRERRFDAVNRALLVGG
jgi:hypothetical protein